MFKIYNEPESPNERACSAVQAFFKELRFIKKKAYDRRIPSAFCRLVSRTCIVPHVRTLNFGENLSTLNHVSFYA